MNVLDNRYHRDAKGLNISTSFALKTTYFRYGRNEQSVRYAIYNFRLSNEKGFENFVEPKVAFEEESSGKLAERVIGTQPEESESWDLCPNEHLSLAMPAWFPIVSSSSQRGNVALVEEMSPREKRRFLEVLINNKTDRAQFPHKDVLRTRVGRAISDFGEWLINYR